VLARGHMLVDHTEAKRPNRGHASPLWQRIS
jgi:hypothetical protein